MGTALGFSDEIEVNNPDMIFTDRDEPRKKFWDAYDALQKNGFYVINYYGFGGIGKSWLCKHLNDVLKGHQHPYTGVKINSKSLIINFEELKNNCDKINVLTHLANKFENECGYSFPIFKYGLYIYYRTQGFTNDSPEINKIQDNEIVNVALEFLDKVPVVGGIGAMFLKVADSLTSQVKNLLMKNSDTIKKLDTMIAEDIAKELVTIFGRELYSYTVKEEQPVVIFMDTYEQLQNYVYQTTSAKVSEEWLWSINGLIRRLPNIIWVLAGQRQVTWGAEDKFWMDEENILYESIKEIDEKGMIKDLFHKLGIMEEDIIDTIIEHTNGVPVHMAMCKDTYFNLKKSNIQPTVEDFDMGYSELAKRFVGGLSSQLKDIVDVLACLESWTQADIIRLDLSPDAYEYIMQLSFISFNEGFYYMHNSVQEIVYKNCSNIIQEKCFRYFEKRLKDSTITELEKKNYMYKKLKLQLCRMETLVDEESKIKGYTELLDEYVGFIRDNIKDYNFFERMRKLINENISEQYMVNPYGKMMDAYVVYHAVLNGEYAVARYYFQNTKLMEGHSKMDKDTRALLYYSLAKYETNQKDYNNARNYYLEAYQLRKGTKAVSEELELLADIAKNALFRERYKEAEYYCDMGLEKVKEIHVDTQTAAAHCEYFIVKAKIGRLCGEYKKALEFLKLAEEVIKEFIDSDNEQILYEVTVIYEQYYYIYGSIDRLELRKEYAKKSFEISERLYDKMPSQKNYRNVGIAYFDLAKCSLSEEDKVKNFDKAIERFEEIYQNEKSIVSLTEWFEVIRIAASFTKGDVSKGYLESCQNMIDNYGADSILWEKLYYYHREWFLYYDRKKDIVAEGKKLDEIEQLLEARKERLSEVEYLDFKEWNLRMRGYWCKDTTGSIYEALPYFEKANALQYKVYSITGKETDAISYANSCKLVAHYYEQLRLYSKVLCYAKEQQRIMKKHLEEFLNYKIVDAYIWCLEMLNSIHELNKDGEAVIENCRERLHYHKILYEREKTLDRFSSIVIVLGQMEKYIIKKGEYKQLLSIYKPVLDEYMKFYDIEETNMQKVDLGIDLVKCKIARIYYWLRINLDEARIILINAKCGFNDFGYMDRLYFLDLVEREIRRQQVKITPLSREEGIALLTEE